MFNTDGSIPVLAQTLCSLLTYLFLSVYGLTCTCQEARNIHSRQLRGQTGAVRNPQSPNQEQQFSVQIGESYRMSCKAICHLFGEMVADAGHLHNTPRQWAKQHELDRLVGLIIILSLCICA